MAIEAASTSRPLAEQFKGMIYGVDPSVSMVDAAIHANPHPKVRYLAGCAEAIPLASDSCDLVTMFLSLHHVSDLKAAVREISRVLRTGGRIFINSGFSGELLDQPWYAFFPRVREIEDKIFPSRAEVLAEFSRTGITMIDLTVVNRGPASLTEIYSKLQRRAVSTFDYLDESEIAAGFAAMREAISTDPSPQSVDQHGMLLVLGCAVAS